jgi:hypothetical protein
MWSVAGETTQMHCGHNVMIDQLAELAAILQRLG